MLYLYIHVTAAKHVKVVLVTKLDVPGATRPKAVLYLEHTHLFIPMDSAPTGLTGDINYPISINAVAVEKAELTSVPRGT